jgi:hypothetical protein
VHSFGEKDARTLWYHAVRTAMYAALMKPCLHQSEVTRFQERCGRVFNLSDVVMLPFALPMVVRNRVAGQDGRGSVAVYIGPSSVVKGGIITFMVESKRVQQKYSFVPRERMPVLNDIDVARVVHNTYGDIVVGSGRRVGIKDAGGPVHQKGFEGDHGDECGQDDLDGDGSSHGGEPCGGDGVQLDEKSMSPGFIDGCRVEGSDGEAEKMQPDGEGEKMQPSTIKNPINHRHFTRSKGKVMAVGERPPKPLIPPKHVAMNKPEWKEAMRRELEKINDEDTIHELPVDDKGEVILPDNPIIMRMFEILDYKWKVDPETGQERWLEVVRAVVDGSVDKRKEDAYAETPDRTVLLMMMSFGATLGEKSITGDAVRAYLNAEALDDNLVVVASKYMKSIPRVGLLNKGLYGTLKGALGWEKWIDRKIIDILEFRKSEMTRGLYLHQKEGVMTRLYRHSDDFRMSSQNEEILVSLSDEFSHAVRMSKWTRCDRFLGLTIEHFEDHRICVIRNEEKIMELEKDFGFLRNSFNCEGKKRLVPLPLEVIKSDDELSGGMEVYLDHDQKVTYMKVVGKIGYISTTLRHDVRYGYLIISRRLARPRRWEMHLAVWIMEYLIGSKDVPLILGGDEVNITAVSDASFATLEERKSVKAHMLKTGSLSGAFYVNVGAVKNIVTSVWEAEINAASDAVDSMIYARNVCKDLKYNSGINRVLIDNQSAINWLNGSNISASTRHVDIRMYRLRQILKEQLLQLEYVKTAENEADLFTKSLPVDQFRLLMGKVMGHSLVKTDLKVRGVKYWEEAT